MPGRQKQPRPRRPARPRASASAAEEKDRRRVFLRAALRGLDEHVIGVVGLPGIVLMENAALAVADAAREMARRHRLRSVLVVAGPGNNGGDGLAALRHLSNAGLRCAAVLAADQSTRWSADALVHLRVANMMQLRAIMAGRVEGGGGEPRGAALAATVLGNVAAGLTGPVLLIDAIFGTGLNRPIEPDSTAAGLIECLNTLRRTHRAWRTLAVDLPSGLDADTGSGLAPSGPGCVLADATVTLVGLKRGMLRPLGRHACGRVTIGDIGAPALLVSNCALPNLAPASPRPVRGATAPARRTKTLRGAANRPDRPARPPRPPRPPTLR